MSRAARVSAPVLPPSPTSFGWNLIGVAVLLSSALMLRGAELLPLDRLLIVLGCTAAVLILIETFVLKSWRNPSTGLDWSRSWRGDWRRIGMKYLGFGTTVGLVTLAYWAFPEYERKSYEVFWQLLDRSWPFLLAAVLIYIAAVDGRQHAPEDIYWAIGRAVCGKTDALRAKDLRQHLLAWTIKGFFLPLMIGFLANNLAALQTLNLNVDALLGDDFFKIAWNLLLTIDVGFALLGYILSLRILDTHLRSAEPTALGWMVALACYPPFSETVFGRYFAYQTAQGFGDWLTAPLPQTIWGGVILLLLAIYAFSTVAFGLRFSNLTHRGIITNGPYRYSKHPAYLAKSLMWWMSAVPFAVASSASEALRLCLLLLGVNLLYYWRARTEERHLSADPVYVEYALWINRHGLLRGLPWFKYRPPRPLDPATAVSPTAADKY